MLEEDDLVATADEVRVGAQKEGIRGKKGRQGTLNLGSLVSPWAWRNKIHVFRSHVSKLIDMILPDTI